MNAKMDFWLLPYQIRTDLSYTTAKFTILKVHASEPKLLPYCVPKNVNTDSELSVTQVLKNSFRSKLLSYKNQSNDFHCKSVGWFLYGTSFY